MQQGGVGWRGGKKSDNLGPLECEKGIQDSKKGKLLVVVGRLQFQCLN